MKTLRPLVFTLIVCLSLFVPFVQGLDLTPNRDQKDISYSFASTYPSRVDEMDRSKATTMEPNPTLRALSSAFIVSPNGSAGGNGSISSPWDLQTALSHPSIVQPGDTIYLRGGVYHVPTTALGFRSWLTGTATAPIRVMSYPGEWAVIDGNVSFSPVKSTVILRIDGAHTWFMNFEITNTEIGTRKISITGSNPPERRANSIDDAGMGTKIINLIIHDTGQGIAAANDVNGNEYYGNVVYNNGWDAPDRRHGHGNYIQNEDGSKFLEENFFFNQFGDNSTVYTGSGLAGGRNLTWKGNIFFNGGMSWWGPNISNLIVRENFTYNQLFKVGNNLNMRNTSADIQYNHFMAGVFLDELAENVTFKNNTVWYGGNDGIVRLQVKNFWVPAKFTFNNNLYYKGGINPPNGQFRIDYRGAKSKVQIVRRFNGSFAYNRTSGSQAAAYEYTGKSWQDDFQFDRNSTYIDAAPSGTKVFVRPNRYAAGRANIIIYNWNQASTVSVNVGATLTPGDSYELHNVQDYFGDIQTGVYGGGTITVSMVGRTRAKPIGYDQTTGWYHDPLIPSTFPTFGAFVLIRTSSN